MFKTCSRIWIGHKRPDAKSLSMIGLNIPMMEAVIREHWYDQTKAFQENVGFWQ
jgi:hypothetical protein